MARDDPHDWRLDIPEGHIDLYLDLAQKPRALTPREAEIMVELVDAWRTLEHTKRIALESIQTDSMTES